MGLAAAADNTEYHSRGRRCDRRITDVFAAADNTGYHSRGRRHDRCITEVFAAADNTGYHSRGRRHDRCITEVFAAADNTGYHSRGRRCDRCMTEVFAAADNTGYHSRLLCGGAERVCTSEYMRSRWRKQSQLRCPSQQQVSQSPLNLRGSRAAHIFASYLARLHRLHQIPEAGPP